MATSLLALLDDIATVLDDVAVMSKIAARKSAARSSAGASAWMTVVRIGPWRPRVVMKQR